MHMADALLSPLVGLAGWAGALGLLAAASREVVRPGNEDGAGLRSIPLAGVMGAFVFSAQMLNFTIPGTGSSGHVGGGLLLAALLGPQPAFLVLSSILAIQALFFADGGLLAWGCNVLNLGLFPCFVAYPLVFWPIARGGGSGRRTLAAVLGAVVGLELGALGVVLETTFSGVAELPFNLFAGLMLPVHLVIGLVEGLATAAVLAFLARVEPNLLDEARGASGRSAVPALGISAVLAAGVFSWFASTHPDGLEWSIARVTGTEAPAMPRTPVHAWVASVQRTVAFLPDYSFGGEDAEEGEPTWPSVQAGTSTAGLAGVVATLALIGLAGVALRRVGRLREGG